MKRSSSAVAEAPNTQRLKPGWRLVRFDEIAENITDRVDDPSQAGVDRYVGLEHLDPESLKIRRWGAPTDVEATKLRFRPGDIIFGKRRAYQRKLAVADFHGICSAHAMVLRAKPEGVVPEFLPFFMQGDGFFEKALAISVGSLSPTINWASLAKQTFCIPPRGLQQAISSMLARSDEVIRAWERVFDGVVSSKKALLAAWFPSAGLRNHWPVKLLADIADLQTGIALGKKYPGVTTRELPYLRVANVKDGALDLSTIKSITVRASDVPRFLLRPRDVLITEGGDFDKVGRGCLWRGEIAECLHQNHVFCVRADHAVLLPEFLAFQTASPHGKSYFLRCAKKTSNLASINATQVKKFPVILPSRDEQERMVALLVEHDDAITHIDRHVANLKKVREALYGRLILLTDSESANVR